MNYNIVEQNLNTLLNRIDRLNAKLVRIGAAPVVYKQVGHTDEPHPVEASKLVRYIELEISADTAKANGWEFVATLVHTDDGNIIRSVPGFAVPVEFRDKATWCDHCQTSRLRRDTYIVRHADGRVMQVGSNCLQEFIGQPAGRLARGTDLLLNVYDMCESATKTNWLGGHNGLNTFRIDLDTFLANVAAVVLKDGKYLTRKMATAMGGNEMTTAERGYKATMGQFTCGDEPLYPVTDEAKKMANDARTFALNRLSPVVLDVGDRDDEEIMDNLISNLKGVNQKLSDFEHNLLACARAAAIEQRLIGIAGYIVEYFRRDQPVARKAIAQVTDLDPDGLIKIFAMFTSAHESKLQRPAIRLADDTGSRLHLSLAGEASKNAGCIYVKQEKGDKAYYGKITPQGRFLPVSSCPTTVEGQLQAFAADPEAIATKYGKLTGHCCFCGRNLTDDRSTDVGYGPVCAGKFGLHWGCAAQAPSAVEQPV